MSKPDCWEATRATLKWSSFLLWNTFPTAPIEELGKELQTRRTVPTSDEEVQISSHLLPPYGLYTKVGTMSLPNVPVGIEFIDG